MNRKGSEFAENFNIILKGFYVKNFLCDLGVSSVQKREYDTAFKLGNIKG